MSRKSEMKVATRLAIGFGAVCAIGVGVATFGTLEMRKLAADIDDVANSKMVKVEQFTQVMNNLNDIGRYTRNIMINPDEGFRAAEEKKIGERRAVRLDGGYHKRDGYIKDVNSDRRFNDLDRWSVRGQALFEVYSPELVSAQREYAIAAQGVGKLGEAGGEAQGAMKQLAESALLRAGSG